MRRLFAAMLLISLACVDVAAQLPSPQSPTVGGVANKPRAKRQRGARPSPAWKILAVPTHQAKATPATFLAIPKTLSYWGNDVDGDCVTAEEMFAKSAWASYVGGPEISISYNSALGWAQQNGFTDGASLTDVMDVMASKGIAINGVVYTDGPYSSVNWASDATLRSAIFTGPVKLGVAADQLENVVNDTNGWILHDAKRDPNEDHCIGLSSFGTLSQLCTAMKVAVPAGANATEPSYGAFTWDTYGIITQSSLIAITSEAYVRNPTTPQQTPAPAPTPTPSPVPLPAPPAPAPVPAPLPPPSPAPVPFMASSILIDLTGHAITAPATFRHSWGIKGDGTITIHPALGTIIVPQNTTINGAKFSE